MKEFMLLIRNESNSKSGFTPEKEKQFLKACEAYIAELRKNGNLKSAQPMIREGNMVSGQPGAFRLGPFSEDKEVIVGYYHLYANDLEEAISLAKGNPEFAFTSTAKIEVRPLKTVEKTTGFEYPAD